jgi:hypothetical protein
MLRCAGGLAGIGLLTLCVLGLATTARGDEPLMLPPTDGLPESFSPEASVDPSVPQPGEYLPAGEVPADACWTCPGVRYWVVSSRHASQDAECLGALRCYERRCDGCLAPSDCNAMISQFIPGAPVLVCIHGSYVDYQTSLEYAESTYWWIRKVYPCRPLNVVFYTWPSERTRCLLAICELNQLGRRAETNAFYLSCLLSWMPDCHPVCLIGHSHGARLALATAHLAGGGSIEGRRTAYSVGAKRLRVILAAGAVDNNWLNDCARYDRALCRAEGILNLRNRKDVVLKLYPLLRPLANHRALGTSGVTFFNRQRQTCPDRVKNLDVTNMVGFGHVWPKFIASHQLACTIAGWVYYPEVNPELGIHVMEQTPEFSDATLSFESRQVAMVGERPASGVRTVTIGAATAVDEHDSRAASSEDSVRDAGSDEEVATPVLPSPTGVTRVPRAPTLYLPPAPAR